MRVKATKKGFYKGLREPGDVFDMVRADGKEPKGSWFVPVGEPKSKSASPAKGGATVLTDEDLA